MNETQRAIRASGPTVGPVGGKAVAKNSAWALGGRLTLMVGGLLLQILLARSLDPTEFGDYYLVLSVAGLAAVVARLGSPEALVRLLAERPESSVPVIKQGFLLSLVGIVLTSAALLLGGARLLLEGLFSVERFPFIEVYIVVMMVLLAAQIFISESFRGFNDIRWASVFNGASRSVMLVIATGVAALLIEDLSLQFFLGIAITVGLITDLAGAWLLRRHVKTSPRSGPKLSVRELWSIAWPMMTNLLVLFATVQAGLWVIGSKLSSPDVARFGVAIQLVTLVTLPLVVVNAVAPPLIAGTYKERASHPQLQSTLRSMTTIAGIPSLILLIVFSLIGGPILGLLFGDIYRDSGILLAILALGQSANVWTGPCAAVLRMTGHQRALLTINLVYGVGGLLLSIALIDDFGLVAVAAISSAALIGQNLTILAYSKSRTGLFTFIELKPSQLRQHVEVVKSQISARRG